MIKKYCHDCGNKDCPNFCEWCGHCDCVGNRNGDCIDKE